MNNAELRQRLTAGSKSFSISGLCAPAALVEETRDLPSCSDDLKRFDLRISDGQVAEILPPGAISDAVHAENRIVLPCFADIHTHLDLGHVVDVAPNHEGTHFGAVQALTTYRKAAIARGEHWLESDLDRRMEFGVRCSYAHGTAALRTHLGSRPEEAKHSWKIFAQLRERWRGKVEIQGVSLVPIDQYLGDYGRELADRVAAAGGVLGGVTRLTGQAHGEQNDEKMQASLQRLFRLAAERDLDIDLHVDETGDPKAKNLDAVARTALACSFRRRVLCGHCCSLSVRSPDQAHVALSLCRDAGVAVVAMPHVNLYLQGRTSNGTPRWRGITLLRELRDFGIPVALATDDVRDYFYPFGDHDLISTFAIATVVGHLDQRTGDWLPAITRIPADLMRLGNMGRLRVGLSADLVIFSARRYSELLSRPDHERILIRAGKCVKLVQVDYSELDESRELSY
jgi:cytosine/creatinine deaminase